MHDNATANVFMIIIKLCHECLWRHSYQSITNNAQIITIIFIIRNVVIILLLNVAHTANQSCKKKTK